MVTVSLITNRKCHTPCHIKWPWVTLKAVTRYCGWTVRDTA